MRELAARLKERFWKQSKLRSIIDDSQSHQIGSFSVSGSVLGHFYGVPEFSVRFLRASSVGKLVTRH